MKRILSLIAVLILTLSASAQVRYQIGTPTRDVETMRDHYMDGALYLGLKDTTFTPTRKGTTVTRPADGMPYYWNGTRWYNMLNSGIGNPIGINNTTTRLVFGNVTWSGSGLIFDVSACEYYILGRHFFSNATQKTLTTADPSLNRIDVIYMDTSGLIGILTGTPALNPIKPIVNSLSQLELTSIDVAAGSTTPIKYTNTSVYDENVEFTGTSNGNVIFTYPSNPKHGSYSTRFQPTLNPLIAEYSKWTSDSTLSISDYQYLRFYIRLNQSFVNDNSSVIIYFMNDASNLNSNGIVIKQGSFGFDRLLINQWQLISIPINSLIFYSYSFNAIKFMTPNEIGDYQIDDVVLQSNGITTNSGSGVTSFSKTDNWGIISTVTNPTTTPNHTVGVDSSVVASKSYVDTKDALNVTNVFRKTATDSIFQTKGGVDVFAFNSTGSGTPSLTQYRLAIGDASNQLSDNAAITGDRALASDANGVPVASSTTATELGYVNGVTSSIQTQLNAKLSNITGLVTAGTNVTVTGAGTGPSPYVVGLSGIIPIANGGTGYSTYDTTALASFGGGSGAAGDTAVFSTSAIYGSFFNSGYDTLYITRIQVGLQGTSPSVAVKVWYNDSLNVTAGGTALVTAGNTCTDTYTGTSITTFDSYKIPPGVWVWVKTSTVTTKPTYFTLTLIGYKKRV